MIGNMLGARPVRMCLAVIPPELSEPGLDHKTLKLYFEKAVQSHWIPSNPVILKPFPVPGTGKCSAHVCVGRGPEHTLVSHPDFPATCFDLCVDAIHGVTRIAQVP